MVTFWPSAVLSSGSASSLVKALSDSAYFLIKAL